MKFLLSSNIILELSVLMGIVGAVIGSFLNVVVLRHIGGKENVMGRSHCMSCQKKLAWYELIPVLSYLVQLGKCRKCKIKLSIQYPLVELGTGILFILVFLHHPLSSGEVYPYSILILALHLTVWSLFMVIMAYDQKTKLIPDVFSYSLAFISFLSMFMSGEGFVTPSYTHLLAGPLFFLPFYLLWKVSDGKWIGLGDGKLSLSIGWFLGFGKGLTAILFAFWIGAVVSLLIIGFQKVRTIKRKDALTLKSEIPFGPFLILGTLLVYIFNYSLYSSLAF